MAKNSKRGLAKLKERDPQRVIEIAREGGRKSHGGGRPPKRVTQ